jgi:hypothetical protein
MSKECVSPSLLFVEKTSPKLYYQPSGFEKITLQKAPKLY